MFEPFVFLTSAAAAFVGLLVVYYFRARMNRARLDKIAAEVARDTSARFDWSALTNSGFEFGRTFVEAKRAPAGCVTCDYCGGNTITAARSCEGCGAPLPAHARQVDRVQPAAAALPAAEPAPVEVPPAAVLAVGAMALMLVTGRK